MLVDETTGSSQSLGSESLSGANSAFATRTVAVAEDALFPGDHYHLELRSTTSTSSAQAGVTGSISVRYDNVALSVSNEGPGGASGSPGVKFTGPPLSQKQIKKLTLKIRWAAAVGRLPGGSVVAREDCTIVGTPRADRIKGSTGNDVICGLGGKDRINGRRGRDIIDGGSGGDRLNGSKGADILAGLAGGDRLAGGRGKDRAGGGAGRDRIFGSAGKDTLKAASGRDRISGGPGRDRISGGPGLDRVVGAGPDRLRSVERRA